MTYLATTSTLVSAAGEKSAAKKTCLRSMQLFKGRVPEFAQAQWLAIQPATVCSDAPPLTSRASSQIHTYAVIEDGRAVLLVFFRIDKNIAQILNDSLQNSGVDMQQFCRHLFQHFPAVRRICFFSQQRFIQAQGKKHFAHPTKRLMLPRHLSGRMEQSLRLSHHNIKYFLQRLKQDHPDFEVECHTNTVEAAQHCRALLQWNRARPGDKRQADLPLDEAGENLVRAVREAGLVCLLKIGGRIAAGTICLRSGRDNQLHFLAHDPRLQAYGLGMLCCYFTVCEHLDKQRNKSGATINRPRPTYTLTVKQERTPVLTLHRPHASWLVRCDHAMYSVCMNYLQRAIELRDDSLQLWQALVRLISSGGLAWRILKKRLASLWRLSSLPAFLRSH